MPRSSVVFFLIALVVAGGMFGCAAASKIAYSPDEVRAEVMRRAPSVSRNDIVVPSEVGEAHVARAREVVRYRQTDSDRVRSLAQALFDPKIFGLQYAPRATASAEEVLRESEGNCLGLASVFVGLARSIGLKAYYIDASTRIHETRSGENGMTVNLGHLTAMVQTGDKDIALDIEHLGRIRWYRIIDDLEALAHFYNNRGFDLIEDSQSTASGVDWTEAARNFRLAVQVMPNFALGWNNLGIAAARIGHYGEAIEDYQTSIRHNPTLAAPHHNLGSLYLQIGNARSALKSLETAAHLDPRGPHIQYNLALARLRMGDRIGAIKALHRATDLRDNYREARALLNQLTLAATTP